MVETTSLTFSARWRSSRATRINRCAVALAIVVSVALPSANTARAEEAWTTGWPAGQPSDSVSVLAVAGGEVAYAGTSAGLFRTANGGASWSPPNAALGTPLVIAVSPVVPRALYVYAETDAGTASTGTLWRSDDGGAVWRDPTGGRTPSLTGRITALLVDRDSPDTVLAGTFLPGGDSARLLRSTDGGVTWQTVYTGQSPFAAAQFTSLVEAPSDRGILYGGYTVYHGGALVRSADGGSSWALIAMPPEPLLYPRALAVAPDNPQHVYVALEGPMGSTTRLYHSTDGGATWTKIGFGLPGAQSYSAALVVDPSGSGRLFLSLQGAGEGTYASYDAGLSFAPLNAPPGGPRSIVALAMAPSGRLLFAGAANGVWQRATGAGSDWGIDARFADYYRQHDGLRVLGSAIAGPALTSGYYSQLFEKGRIEDHSAETGDPNWKFMYGLLVDELQQQRVSLPVGGEVSTISYAGVGSLASPSLRLAAPAGFRGGIQRNADGSTFVPFSATLAAAPGHNVAPRFWAYINRADLFPGGWLHDIGLPITEAVTAVVDKGDVKARAITIQAFQRAVLTDDPANPIDWQVERANVGTDYQKSLLHR